MKCCNQEMLKKNLDNGIIGLFCKKCQKKGEGKNEAEAFKNQQNSIALISIPRSPEQLYEYSRQKEKKLLALSAPFVANDKGAFQRMVDRNTRYIVNQKSSNWLKVWGNEEGQQSIVYALEDAYMLGASLPEMGAIVPFGNVAEFIPAFEAYEFALTNGENAPFSWIQVEMIYENDEFVVSRKNGVFSIEIQSFGKPRGELEQVAVYGKNKKLNMIIGDIYDVERLMKKAEQHSISYRHYIREKAMFDQAESEGKLKTENGMNYLEKQIPKKDGSYWTKKIYMGELTNPYEEANRPEMFRKMAAKSFLRPFIKVRNSEAAYNEQKEKNVDELIEAAFEATSCIVEDYIIKEEENPQKNTNLKNDDKHDEAPSKTTEKELFPNEEEKENLNVPLEVKFDD